MVVCLTSSESESESSAVEDLGVGLLLSNLANGSVLFLTGPLPPPSPRAMSSWSREPDALLCEALSSADLPSWRRCLDFPSVEKCRLGEVE